MKILLSFFFALVFFAVNAQERRYNSSQYDFSNVDVSKVDEEKIRRTLDSLYIASGIDSLHALRSYIYDAKNKESNDYGAFVFGLDFGKLSLNTLNKKLKENGFDPLTETLPAVYFGLDVLSDRWLFSWVGSIKVKERLQNDDVRISFASSGMFTLGVGYDILNLKRIQLYPQLALSYQKFSMDVRQREIDKDGGFPYFINNTYESNVRKRSLAGLAGAELDIHIVSQEDYGFILAIRAGVQKTLIDGDFRMHHRSYDLNLGNVDREAFLSVGFKYFMR